MENKKFDDFIRRAMENLDGENYIPQDWSSMENSLDTDAGGFDQFIANSLDNLDGGKFVAMDWSRMEDKLDSEIEADSTADSTIDPQLEDIYLDAVAYDHLNSIETPYNKEHWEIMSVRLDEEYARRRRVILTKSLEAAIILLLIWTGINFFPNKDKTVVPVAPVASLSIHDDTNNLIVDQQQFIPGGESIANNESAVEKVELVPNVAVTTRDDFSPSKNEIVTSLEVGNDDVIVINRPTIAEKIGPSISQNAPIIFEESNNPFIKLNPNQKTLAENSTEASFEKEDVGIYPIPTLASGLLEFDQTNEQPFAYSDLFRRKRVRTHEMFFSMFTSANYDYIETDFFNKKSNEQDVYNRGRYGYGGGFALGFQLKKLLVETGASYSFLSYQQREDTKILGNFAEGYIEEQWQDAEIEMFHIPINIQYYFLNGKKWKMYSLTGASLNMALRNNFSFQVEGEAADFRSPSIQRNTIANVASNYNGIFEGGTFRENSYLTANLGFGLERTLSYRWSLYMQPIYRHYLLFKGIGPNQDRIHSGSIRFGAKVKLR